MRTDDEITGPMNLGNPGEFTILELAQKIIQMTGSKSKLIFQPLPGDDPTQRKPDIAFAEKALDWRPKVHLEEGLVKTIDYFRRLAR